MRRLLPLILLLGCTYTASGECDYECPEDFNPVCATSGTTYDNECELQCAGDTYENTGDCTDEERPDDR